MLALEHFHRNRVKADGYGASCKPCQRAYNQAHYEANKDFYKRKARVHNDRRAQELRAIIDAERKKHSKCPDCRRTWPLVALDFDHVRGKKLFNISHAPTMACSPKRLLLEIAKCEVVCASCHRVRTANRRSQNLPR